MLEDVILSYRISMKRFRQENDFCLRALISTFKNKKTLTHLRSKEVGLTGDKFHLTIIDLKNINSFDQNIYLKNIY